MKTKAAILKKIGDPIELWELELPLVKRGQVLVEVAYSGICRSQINEIKGFKGADPYLPHTLGHEGSGIVREIGQDVSKVKVGDHVVLSWIKGAGIEAGGCVYKAKNHLVNSGPISTFLTFAIISENRLTPISKDLSLRSAALLGCAIPTGAGIVMNQLELTNGSSCAIFGAGGIGLSAILAAKFLNASQIIAVDINEQKLKLAQKLGATHTINCTLECPVEAIKTITESKGAAGVVESVGNADTMEMAFKATSTNGKCVIAGNLPKGQEIKIDPFDLILGKKLIGSWGGGSLIDSDIPKYVDMILKGKIQTDALITHEIKLEEINQTLLLLDNSEVGRALIKLAND